MTFVDGRQHDFWRVDEQRLRAALGRPQGEPRRAPLTAGAGRHQHRADGCSGAVAPDVMTSRAARLTRCAQRIRVTPCAWPISHVLAGPADRAPAGLFSRSQTPTVIAPPGARRPLKGIVPAVPDDGPAPTSPPPGGTAWRTRDSDRTDLTRECPGHPRGHRGATPPSPAGLTTPSPTRAPARARARSWRLRPASTARSSARTSPTWAATAPGASATTSTTCATRSPARSGSPRTGRSSSSASATWGRPWRTTRGSAAAGSGSSRCSTPTPRGTSRSSPASTCGPSTTSSGSSTSTRWRSA